MHFWRCIFWMSRKHYKNRGFGTSSVKVEKTGPFRGVSVCFGEARDFRTKISHFWLRASKHVFFCAVPETTFFIVVSGPHTEVALADVPETTIKIVVSETWGEKEKPAEPQKRGQIKNEDMFGGAVPETTVFTVVSGAHTGVVLAHVAETTSFIGASGTWGDEDKQAKEKTNKSRQLSISFFVQGTKRSRTRRRRKQRRPEEEEKQKKNKKKKTKKKEKNEKKKGRRRKRRRKKNK